MKSQKIKNYENYSIDTDGTISRILKSGQVKAVNTRETLTGNVVTLSNGSGTEFNVARLVLDTFTKETGTIVKYKDGNCNNCALSNVEYTTGKTSYYGTAFDTINSVPYVRVSKFVWVGKDGTTLNRTIAKDIIKTPKPGSSSYIYLPGDKPRLLHRVVAEFFVPNPYNYPIVDHIDENKFNNCSSNLRWCTYKQNSHFYISDNGNNTRREAALKLLEDNKATKAKLAALSKELSTMKAAIIEKEKKFIAKEATFEAYITKVESQLATARKLAIPVQTSSGKSITVDNIVFPSAGSAAKYIYNAEAAVGNTRSQATISKELRRYLQGKRPAWYMYEKYYVC